MQPVILSSYVLNPSLHTQAFFALVEATAGLVGISEQYWQLADYDQPESLAEAFAGTSKLLFISSSHTDDTVRIRQHTHVIEIAILTSGIPYTFLGNALCLLP